MRDRLLLPLFVPAAVAGVIVLIIFSAAKILLNFDDPRYPTMVAGVIAVVVLAVAALIAEGPRLRAPQVYVITALPLSVLIAIGLFIAARPEPEQAGGGEAATTTSVEEVATDNAFNIKAFSVPIGQEVTLTLTNKGQAIHNWTLKDAKNRDGTEIKTQNIDGGKSETIKFTISQAGSYDFTCTIHPQQMFGKVTAVEGPASAGPVASANFTTTDDKFDKNAFTIKAGDEVTLSVTNKGQNQHNLHILNVKGKDGNDIKTAIQGNGQTDTIKFTIDQPGTYDFQCDVHATTMKGKVTVVQ